MDALARALNMTPKKLCKLEIRTDSEFVVFRGRPDATGPQQLTGRVVLMNADPIEAKSIKIILQGKRTVSHVIDAAGTEKRVMNCFPNPVCTAKHTFYHQDHQLQSASKLPAGNHEFPFGFQLPGDSPESIEGFRVRWPIFQIYQLKVVIERRLPYKDLTETKHVRVIRTLANDLDLVLESAGVSGTWIDKIMYEWNVRAKGLIYGDQITLDFAFTPLAKKLRVGKFTFFIKETVLLKTQPGLQDIPHRRGELGDMWKEIHYTDRDIKQRPEAPDGELHPEFLIAQEKYSITFDLPKSLRECRQTVDDGEWIRISHGAHVHVELHNEDGHLSELKLNLPVRLDISPLLLPIGEDNTVTAPSRNHSSSNLRASTMAIPPAYGDHVQDQHVDPFRDIDPSGFITPAVGRRSGATTPGTANLNGSNEHTTNSHEQPPPPDALSARLNVLELSRTETIQWSSERAQHVDYDLDELQRVTSYTTAVRNTGPARYSDQPPTYGDATSRPPSPRTTLAVAPASPENREPVPRPRESSLLNCRGQ